MGDEILELKGRLYLWQTALHETRLLLKLSRRAADASNSSKVIEERDIFHKAQWDYKESLPKTIAPRIARDMEVVYSQSYPRDFPTWEECISLQRHCVSLAVIYFCQILTIGYGDPDKASKNNKKEIFDARYRSIIEHVFVTKDEQYKFEKLCDSLLEYRNEMLAHADARAFDIQHDGWMTKMKIPSQENINVEYWLSLLFPLEMEISNFLQSKNR